MDRSGLLVALLVAWLPAAGTGAEPGTGQTVGAVGAAGVMEVGRPLDMVRTRAERQARARATEEAVKAAVQVAVAIGAEPAVAGDIEERLRSGLPAGTWELRYWSNGAVTARWSLPVTDAVTEDRPGN